MTPMSIHPWSSAPLSNSELFEFESGIWTGKKPPVRDLLRASEYELC